MIQEGVYNNKWLHITSLGVLFTSLALSVYTGSYYLLLVPFAFLYLLLMGLNWKAAYWIFLFCIPASVQLSIAGDTLGLSLPDEPLMWLFLLLFIVMWARKPDLLPQWYLRNPLVFIVVLQLVWLIVPVIYSAELLFAIKFFIAKVWYLVCFFVLPIWVFTAKKDFKKGFILLLIPILATTVIIFIRHAMINFNFRKVEKAIGGIYYNHVDYSTVISMFFPLLCVALPLSKGKTFITRGILLLITLFFIPAILLTYARAAVIALVFAGGIALAIRMRLVNWVMPVFYGMLAIMLVYLVNNNKYIMLRPDFQHTYMHSNYLDHIIATFRGEDMSSMERLYRWVAAIRMSADRPITGYGPHGFYYNYKPYAVTSFRTYVSRNNEHSTTHNYFLYMLVEQGWPAMLLYGALIVAFFAQAQRTYHRLKDKFYRACVMGITMMFAAGFINNFFSELIETHKVGPLFYLCIVLLVILNKKSKDEEATLKLQPSAILE